jgi:hypothetical protein
MAPDENDGPQPRFPDPGRDETRYRPQQPPAGGYYDAQSPQRRRLGCLPAIVLTVLLIFLILLALDLFGVIDVLGR